MYLECRICQRVTDHRIDTSQSKTFNFGTGGFVQTTVFYICPHCNTGVSGTNTTTNFAGKIESKFEKGLHTK